MSLHGKATGGAPMRTWLLRVHFSPPENWMFIALSCENVSLNFSLFSVGRWIQT